MYVFFYSFRQNRTSNIDGREISKFTTWEFIWSYTAKLEKWSKLRVKKNLSIIITIYVLIEAPCFGSTLNIQGWDDWETPSHCRTCLLGSIVQQAYWLPFYDYWPWLWPKALFLVMVDDNSYHGGILDCEFASSLYTHRTPVCPRILAASHGCEIVKDLCGCLLCQQDQGWPT